MSNENESKRPTHIAYQVREGEESKAYFNRIGAMWPHKDGEGFSLQLDSVPVDGRVTVRSVQDRIEGARDEAKGEGRKDARRGTGREDRRDRDGAPRYER